MRCRDLVVAVCALLAVATMAEGTSLRAGTPRFFSRTPIVFSFCESQYGGMRLYMTKYRNNMYESPAFKIRSHSETGVDNVDAYKFQLEGAGKSCSGETACHVEVGSRLKSVKAITRIEYSSLSGTEQSWIDGTLDNSICPIHAEFRDEAGVVRSILVSPMDDLEVATTAALTYSRALYAVVRVTAYGREYYPKEFPRLKMSHLLGGHAGTKEDPVVLSIDFANVSIDPQLCPNKDHGSANDLHFNYKVEPMNPSSHRVASWSLDDLPEAVQLRAKIIETDKHVMLKLTGTKGTLVMKGLTGARFDIDVYATTMLEKGTKKTYSASVGLQCEMDVVVYADSTDEKMWTGRMVLGDSIAQLKKNLHGTSFAQGAVKIRSNDDWVVIAEENDDQILAKYRNVMSGGVVTFSASTQKASGVRLSVCPQASSYQVRLLKWDLREHGGFIIPSGSEHVYIDQIDATFESGHTQEYKTYMKIPLQGEWTGGETSSSADDIMKQVDFKPMFVPDRVPEIVALWSRGKKHIVEVDNSDCTVTISFVLSEKNIVFDVYSKVRLSSAVGDVISQRNANLDNVKTPRVKYVLKDKKPASDIVSVLDLMRAESEIGGFDVLRAETVVYCTEGRMLNPDKRNTVGCLCPDARSFGDKCQYSLEMYACPIEPDRHDSFHQVGIYVSSWKVPSTVDIRMKIGSRAKEPLILPSLEGSVGPRDDDVRVGSKLYWNGVDDLRDNPVVIEAPSMGFHSEVIELSRGVRCSAPVHLYKEEEGDAVFSAVMSRWATVRDVIAEANRGQPDSKKIETLLIYEDEVKSYSGTGAMDEKRLGNFPMKTGAVEFLVNKYGSSICVSVRLFKSTRAPISVCGTSDETTRVFEATYNNLVTTSPVLFVKTDDPFIRLEDSPVTDGMEVLAVTRATWTYIEFFKDKVSREDIEKAISIGKGDILAFTAAANTVYDSGKEYTNLDNRPIREQIKKKPTMRPCKSERDCPRLSSDAVEFCQVNAYISSIYRMEPYCAFAPVLGSIRRRDLNIGARGKSSLGLLTDIYQYMIPTQLEDDDEVVPFPSSWDSRSFGDYYGYSCDMATEVLDQTNCGTCWAYATASTVSQHMCIATKGAFNMMVSVGDLTARAWDLKLGFDRKDYEFHDSGYEIEKNPYMRRFGNHGGNHLDAMRTLAGDGRGSVPEICRPSRCDKATRAKAKLFAELIDLFQTARTVPKANELVKEARARTPEISKNPHLKWTVSRVARQFLSLRKLAKKARGESQKTWSEESSFHAPLAEGLRDICSDEDIVPSVMLDKSNPTVKFTDFVSDYKNAMDGVYHHIRFKGPVAVNLLMDLNYFSKVDDVYMPKTFMPRSNHAVTVVGWGEQMGTNGRIIRYWLVQNSYGKSWSSGHEGYFKVQRGFDSECMRDLVKAESSSAGAHKGRAGNMLDQAESCGMDFFFMVMLSSIGNPYWVPVAPVLARSSVDKYVALAERCGSKRCQNGGILMPGSGECTCMCPKSFSGDYCETCVPKECGPRQIQDPKSCQCICEDGFFGNKCSDSIKFALCTDQEGIDYVRVAEREGDGYIHNVGLLDDIGVKTDVKFRYGLGRTALLAASEPVKRGRWSKAFILDDSERDEFGKVRTRTVYVPLIDHGEICHTAMTIHDPHGEVIKIENFLPHQTLRELRDTAARPYGKNARVSQWRSEEGILSDDTKGGDIPIHEDGRRHIRYDLECVGSCGPRAEFNDRCECMCQKYHWGPTCSFSATLALCPQGTDSSKLEVIIDSIVSGKDGTVRPPLKFKTADGRRADCQQYIFDTSRPGKMVCELPADNYVEAQGMPSSSGLDGPPAIMRVVLDSPMCAPNIRMFDEKGYTERVETEGFDVRKTLAELKAFGDPSLHNGRVIREFMHPKTGETLDMNMRASDLPASGRNRDIRVRIGCRDECPPGMIQDSQCNCHCPTGSWGQNCENSVKVIMCDSLLYVMENQIRSDDNPAINLELKSYRGEEWTCEGYIFTAGLSPPGRLLCGGNEVPASLRHISMANFRAITGEHREVRIPITYSDANGEARAFCKKYHKPKAMEE